MCSQKQKKFMRDEGLYLDDVVESCDYIDQFLAGVTHDEFLDNEMLKSAVVQKLIIVGEASARISDTTKARYPQIKWKSATGLRNIAVHLYYEVDWEIIWITAKTLVGPLRKDVARIIETDFPMSDDETAE